MPPHILIIDADESAAQATAAIVRRLAPELTLELAASPDRGMAAMEQRCPDVLIVDPAPFGRRGLALIRRQRVECAGCRIVVLASAPTPALRQQMHDLRVDAYLEKPAPMPLVAERLRMAVHGPGSPGDGQAAPADRGGAVAPLKVDSTTQCLA